MIEIICNGEDDSNKGNMRGNADIRRPKNIKQIGDVSSNRKIYIEDYVYTYLNKLAQPENLYARGAVLFGKMYKTSIGKCIFIAFVFIFSRCLFLSVRCSAA